jgi:ketosteroid isomerase-like protein
MNTNALAIKAAYDATASGDFAPLMGLLADEVQWRATGPGPLAGDYTGKQDIGRFFARMGETYGDTFRLRVLDILGSNEHVVVLTSEEGSYRGGSCRLAVGACLFLRKWAPRSLLELPG